MNKTEKCIHHNCRKGKLHHVRNSWRIFEQIMNVKISAKNTHKIFELYNHIYKQPNQLCTRSTS